MPLSGPPWLLLEGLGAEEATEELGLNILARLAAGPAGLHRLLDDLRRLEEAGLQPPGYTLRDVVAELRLYREAGVVQVDVDGLLHVDPERLELGARMLVYSRAAVVAEALGLEGAALPQPAGGGEAVHAPA
ncbi:hypothetical protein CF15_01490 [Pyrodictium occultum]|uniref:Uncharacterized protein n=1 Tax=Pyrodictium occultum TaxID=2309 RepID=A0A0V8RTZ8_PYROC|nr:hypothetical protein [Pyrodictium occultum]KSW11540.1 hypothetical protein CF15_01490 [Pyrodictium occultum]